MPAAIIDAACGSTVNIEISGVWPYNKGAVLMLEAIRQRLSEEFREVRFAVPLSWPIGERLAAGLWTVAPPASFRSKSSGLLAVMPGQVRKRIGLLREREIDVLLDASGFGYGDFWGLEKLQNRLTRRVLKRKSQGQKSILLPQAVGPFEQAGMAKAFRSALEGLDLAFIRDDASMRFACQAAPEHPRLRRAPDFTNLLEPALPERLNDLRGKSAIIPNEKVTSGRSAAARESYIDFLATAADFIRSSGREAYILVHEGAQDRALADDLNARLCERLLIVDEPDALATKAAIGSADVVVSSRFHGLVSALSSAVPALACGWSHKYAELMRDYGCSEFVVALENPRQWHSQLECFLTASSTTSFRNELYQRAEAEKEKTKSMWTQVLDLLS